MYVISKHRDYYDGVVGTMGIDKTVVFERKTTMIENVEKFPKPFARRNFRDWMDRNSFHEISYYEIDEKNNKNKYVSNYPFIVGFCGKLYIGWKFLRKNPDYIKVTDKQKYLIDFIYDIDEVKKYLKNKNWSSNLNDVINNILSYNPINIFREINAPYFIFDHNINAAEKSKRRNDERFIINPILKDYEFYKVFDTFTAFQEIQMFLSGVLGSKEKNIVEIDDKYKIKQHGFNKWSFRKPPEKK